MFPVPTQPLQHQIARAGDPGRAAAALADLLTLYDLDFTEAEVGSALPHGGLGPSLFDLRGVLASLGLNATGYRLSVAQLERMGAPAIALISRGASSHFTLVVGAREGSVLLQDVFRGPRVMSGAEFERCWNKVALLIEPYTRRVALPFDRDWDAAARATSTYPAFN